MNNSTNVTFIEGIDNCTNLKHLEDYNCSIGSIQSIAGLNNLNYLNISNNKISDILAISNLKKLAYLSLTSNSINDLNPLENSIENGKISLQKLYLNNIIIQITTVSGNNNIQILKNLYKAELRTLDISKNNFTAGSTDELKNLKWTSYKE